MVLKAERERVKALLTEAITVLCKNGLGYKYTCAIEGLLGITLDDDDVFLVNINESIQKAERPPPVEETTKQETGTHSPASSSPSNTPRRRRRRSQEGEGGQSPAKRANYGAEQDHSRIKPQSREDVIVIKEEVSETEFSDFYGDTGGGENEDSGQYVMQQGDQQYPGAGCSQWDTSQTQGGQSDWPAFNPTQQQQAAISQAASSAMMSPSQALLADTTKPCSTLYSQQVRTILIDKIVKPAVIQESRVTSVRFGWAHDNATTEKTWKEIVRYREELDKIICTLPNCVYFVSGITATITSKKIYPVVSYWVVLPPGPIDTAALIEHMKTNTVEAKPTLLLQPSQQTERDITNALFKIVKDNIYGCVPKFVKDSWLHCHPQEAAMKAEHPVRFCMVDATPQKRLEGTVNQLCTGGFYTKLIYFKVEVVLDI